MNTEQLREFCLSLKGVEEGIKWEDHLCFTLAEKIFCITGFGDNDGVSFKVSPDDFALLTERERITQARYFAKNQWVSVETRGKLRNHEWKEYLEKSYLLVKSKLTKKLQKEIDEL
ncbi:MAG: MmcQ/YjbR family DNA-binding protein [Chitinophagales bacterium]|nr:MmcQ/YjbR family DNA-binding protein [Chitinophagales bacterium]